MGELLQKSKFSLGKPGHFITDSISIYKSDKYGNITVPADFDTDFASIPNVVPRWLFDPLCHARWPALFHDYLCREAESYEERVIADHIFLECMEDVGLPKWRRYIMFSAVRLNTYRLKIIGKWR